MRFGERRRWLQTLTTAQLDRRRIDRQLRVLERRTITILRGLGLEKPDQWKGYATPSEAQLTHAMYCANQDIASELENTGSASSSSCPTPFVPGVISHSHWYRKCRSDH